MKIYIAADHRGFEDKNLIVGYLQSLGNEAIDVGDKSLDPEDDFAQYASKAINRLLSDDQTDARGILICGSGQGMCMAANRFKGIRASICWDQKEAYSSRHDDDANVLCLSADNSPWEDMKRIIEVWLSTSFANEERYVRRIKELDKLG